MLSTMPRRAGWSRCLPRTTLCLLALVGLLSAPAWGSISVLGSLDRQFDLAPGQQAQGRVLVRNHASEPLLVRAYLTDLDPRPGGRGFPEAGSEARSNSDWIVVVPQEQGIDPGQTASFEFIARAPDDEAAHGGSFWSVMMIQAVDPGALQPPPAAADGEVQLSIRHQFRTAVRITTHVRGAQAPEPSLRFTERNLVTDNGITALRLELENDGEVSLDMMVFAELFDGEGFSLGRYAPEIGRVRLLPGGRSVRQIILHGLPPGQYEALIVADNHDDNVFAARYQLEVGP